MIEIGYPGAFLAGLISFISPCVLPLVPPYLAYLAGTGIGGLAEAGTGADPALRRRILVQALAFVAGFSTVFVALGASATLIGRLLLERIGWLTGVAGVAIIIMGLHFLGLFRIGWLLREARFEPARRPVGPLGAYVMGLAFAFGWTPCVGPILATILMIAGAEATALRGASLLLAYALGIGVPFLLVALLAGPALNLLGRMKASLGLIEKVTGALLVATGMLILTGSMPVIGNWLLETVPILGRIG